LVNGAFDLHSFLGGYVARQKPDPLSRAAELLRSGYKEDARELLVGFLKDNPNSTKAWWLMSFAASDLDQQISCLKRVLMLSPNHSKAQARLAALTGKSNKISTTNFSPKKPSLSLPAIALLVIFGCIGFLAVGYFGFRIFFSPSTAQPTHAWVVQNPDPGVIPTSEISPTGTSTPLPQLTSTPTVPPAATITPLISNTPTTDLNATRTPIPENQVGIGSGQYPPDFTLINAITNAEVTLRDYVGQPVIIVFLNPTSTESGLEMPELQSVYEKYQDQGLVVLGIGVGASQSALRNYTGRFGGLTFPLLSDWEHDIAGRYEVDTVPTNFFIRKNGRIWQVSIGMLRADELDATIASILKVP
jgi:peroxiredoxin